MNFPRVSIQTSDFDVSVELAALRASDKRIGAICTFIGTVRDRNDGLNVSSMELEHYPGMTEKAIEAMIDEACLRFDIFGARVVHRIGLLQPLDQVVMVAVTSAHRGESFKACATAWNLVAVSSLISICTVMESPPRSAYRVTELVGNGKPMLNVPSLPLPAAPATKTHSPFRNRAVRAGA